MPITKKAAITGIVVDLGIQTWISIDMWMLPDRSYLFSYYGTWIAAGSFYLIMNTILFGVIREMLKEGKKKRRLP